jgi:hypothetical protein
MSVLTRPQTSALDRIPRQSNEPANEPFLRTGLIHFRMLVLVQA